MRIVKQKKNEGNSRSRCPCKTYMRDRMSNTERRQIPPVSHVDVAAQTSQPAPPCSSPEPSFNECRHQYAGHACDGSRSVCFCGAVLCTPTVSDHVIRWLVSRRRREASRRWPRFNIPASSPLPSVFDLLQPSGVTKRYRSWTCTQLRSKSRIIFAMAVAAASIRALSGNVEDIL